MFTPITIPNAPEIESVKPTEKEKEKSGVSMKTVCAISVVSFVIGTLFGAGVANRLK